MTIAPDTLADIFWILALAYVFFLVWVAARAWPRG